MKHCKAHKSFNILASAKFVFINAAFMSMAMLFAPVTFAATTSDNDDLSYCKDINSYLHRYVSVNKYFFTHDTDDLNNEWTLSYDLPGYPVPPYSFLPKDTNGLTTFKLVSIKVITKPFTTGGKFKAPIIESVKCEYKDPGVTGSLYLNLKPSGRISVSETSLGTDHEGNEITPRTVAYVSRGGTIKFKDQWQYDSKAPSVTEFTCTEKSTKWSTQCGGWGMTKRVQSNGFWTNAFANCWNGGWQRCYFNGLLWSYSKDLVAKHHRLTVDTIEVSNPNDARCNLATDIQKHYRKTVYYYKCTLPNPTTAYCKDAKCTEEITAVNNIIGHYPDGREGMASYTRRCWAYNHNLQWKNKQWDKKYEDCSSIMHPTETWPDYSHL